MTKYENITDIEIDDEIQKGLDILSELHPVSQEGVIAIIMCETVRKAIVEDGEELIETSVYDSMGKFMEEVKEAKLTHEEIYDALGYFRQFIYLGAKIPSSKKDEKEA